MDPQGTLSPAPCFLQNYLNVNHTTEVIIKAQVWCYNQKKSIPLGISPIFSLDPLLILLCEASCFLIQDWPASTVLELFQYYKFSFNFSVKKKKATLFLFFLCSDRIRYAGNCGHMDFDYFTNMKIPETSGYIHELINGNKMDLHSVTSYWVTDV